MFTNYEHAFDQLVSLCSSHYKTQTHTYICMIIMHIVVAGAGRVITS